VKLSLVLIGVTASLLAQTPDLQLRVTTAGAQTSFHLGEPIALELSFTSTAPGKYTISGGAQDRMGMEAFREEFHASPQEGTADPLADYFKGGMMAGGLFWSHPLSAEPVVVKKDLNQWLRFGRPGDYRVRAISHRVSVEHKPVAVESNEIEIDLLDDPVWQASQLAEAVRILSTVPTSGDSHVFDRLTAAARQLWYLDSPGSIRESARLLDGNNIQVEQLLRLGLIASSRHALAIETMKGLLADPAQPVVQIFLDTLARIQSSTVQELRPQLAAALEMKQTAAKAVSLRTLIQTVDLPDSVSAAQRAEMAGLFLELPPREQSAVLAGEWARISCLAMIPVLRRIYDTASPTAPNTPLVAAAVQRLYESDPAQARQIVLADIARPVPKLPYATLSILSDSTLPALDEILASNLELGPHQSATREVEELVARYATGAIFPRVKAFYERRDNESRGRKEMVGDPPRSIASPACEPPLYAYFLRTDPRYGEKLLRDVMAERTSTPAFARCWATAIGRTAPYYVNPQWESVALDGLNDSTVTVKIDAVKALGQYGSPASAVRLLDSFRYFHEWWKDKPSQLNDQNRQLEWAYVQTVTQAANWIATADDLARAAAFCITDACRGQMEQSRRYWLQPLEVSAGASSDGSYYVSLAQYNMRSLEEAHRRLLQLPKGTQLSWKLVGWKSRPLEEWVAQMQKELGR
jgi:hypothetical protein